MTEKVHAVYQARRDKMPRTTTGLRVNNYEVCGFSGLREDTRYPAVGIVQPVDIPI